MAWPDHSRSRILHRRPCHTNPGSEEHCQGPTTQGSCLRRPSPRVPSGPSNPSHKVTLRPEDRGVKFHSGVAAEETSVEKALGSSGHLTRPAFLCGSTAAQRLSGRDPSLTSSTTGIHGQVPGETTPSTGPADRHHHTAGPAWTPTVTFHPLPDKIPTGGVPCSSSPVTPSRVLAQLGEYTKGNKVHTLSVNSM